MSTEVEFVNESECLEGMSRVRNDLCPERFVVFGHVNNNPNQITLVALGTDTAEIPTYLDDEQAMCVYGRYDTMFDMSNTVKFVFIYWVGDRVPLAMKGKYRVVFGSIRDWIGSYHLFLETSSRDDITDDIIMENLNENAGKVNKVLDSTDGYQHRGFTASQLPNRQPKQYTTVTSSFTSTRPALEVDEEVISCIKAVQNDMDPMTWFLACYDDNRTKGPLRKVSCGRQDLIELKASLDVEQVMYGYYRVVDIVDEIQTVKFVSIMWVGSDVKPFTKAKVSTHRGVVESYLQPCHASIVASDLSDISDRIVNDKVMGASGTKMNVR